MKLNDTSARQRAARKTASALAVVSALARAKRRAAVTKARNPVPADYHKVGFEGGQMPLQRRLPKRGFASRTARYNDEVRLYQIEVMKADVIDLETLKAEGVVGHDIRKVKVINTGESRAGLSRSRAWASPRVRRRSLKLPEAR